MDEDRDDGVVFVEWLVLHQQLFRPRETWRMRLRKSFRAAWQTCLGAW